MTKYKQKPLHPGEGKAVWILSVEGNSTFVGKTIATFEQADELRNRKRENEVDEGHASPDFDRCIRFGDDELTGTGEFFKTDHGNEGRVLQHRDEFVAKRRNDALEGLRQDDVSHRLCVGHAKRQARTHLALGNRLDAATEDFGNVGGGIHRASRHRGNEGVDTGTENVRQGKVDDEDLNQQRRAADEVHVDFGRQVEEPVARKLRHAEDETEDQTDADGECRNLKCESRAFDQERQALGHKGKIEFHGVGALWLSLWRVVKRGACVERPGRRRNPFMEDGLLNVIQQSTWRRSSCLRRSRSRL